MRKHIYGKMRVESGKCAFHRCPRRRCRRLGRCSDGGAATGQRAAGKSIGDFIHRCEVCERARNRHGLAEHDLLVAAGKRAGERPEDERRREPRMICQHARGVLGDDDVAIR